MQKPNDFDLIVIGKGIASHVLLFELSRLYPDLKILGFHAPKMAPPCSLFTTSVITQNGIQKNISQLGDWLFDSYFMAKDFIEKYRPAGVSECSHYHIRYAYEESSKDNLMKRFKNVKPISNIAEINYSTPANSLTIVEEAFCINPHAYLHWLDNQFSAAFGANLQWIENLVVSVDKNIVTTISGESFTAKKILFATGAAKDILFHNKEKPTSKRIPGSYLETKYDMGQKSYVLSFKDFNFVYRHLDQTLLIGGTTQSNGVMAKDWPALCEFHSIVQKVIPNIPSFDLWDRYTGTRQKGQKRQPYWGPCTETPDIHFEISSLYKNGYTLPFLAAKDLVSQLGF